MKFNIAIQSSVSPHVAYVSVLDSLKDEDHIVVRERDEPSLIRRLWNDYGLVPCRVKPGVFRLSESA